MEQERPSAQSIGISLVSRTHAFLICQNFLDTTFTALCCFRCIAMTNRPVIGETVLFVAMRNDFTMP